MSRTKRAEFVIETAPDGTLSLLVERFGGLEFKDYEELGDFLEMQGDRLSRIGQVARMDAKAGLLTTKGYKPGVVPK